MHFLPFWTIKAMDVTDGSCEITWRDNVTSRKPYIITLQRQVWQTMRHVLISASVGRHMSQLEDVYLYTI